jgi:hypothetical protein
MKQIRKKAPVFLTGILACCLSFVQAQQDSAKLYQKATQLMETINMPAVYANAINASVEQQIAAAPALASFRADLKLFFDSCISWTVLKADVIKLYMKYYTAEEMDTLIKFYQTSAGKKVTAAGATLQKDIQALQQGRLDAHLGEWNQFITNKMNGTQVDTTLPGNN